MIRFGIAALLLALAPPARAAEAFVVPKAAGPVVDAASVLDDTAEAQLTELARVLRDAGGSHVAVLTVPSLGDLTADEAASEVFDEWALGGEDKDDGLLLLVAPQERQAKFVVGGDLQGMLTEGYATRILDEEVLPRLADGKTSDAVLRGLLAAARHTDAKVDLTRFGAAPNAPFSPPERVGRVMDTLGLLPAEGAASLAKAIDLSIEKGATPLQIYTLPHEALGGNLLVDAMKATQKAWKLDDALLLMATPKTVYILAGDDVSTFEDDDANAIIYEIMAPLQKAGRNADALLIAAVEASREASRSPMLASSLSSALRAQAQAALDTVQPPPTATEVAWQLALAALITVLSLWVLWKGYGTPPTRERRAVPREAVAEANDSAAGF